jgi:hypothetical protein
VQVADGEHHSDSHPGQQHERCLQLVPEPELVPLVPPVHARECPTDGVDGQVGAAEDQKEERGDGNTDGHPQRGQVVIVGRAKAVEFPEVAENRPHRNPFLAEGPPGGRLNLPLRT